MSNHTPGSHDDIVPYRDPWKDLDPGTEPDVVTNSDRLVEHKPSVALIREQRVAGRMESATGTDQNMIPEDNLASVQDSHAMIGEEILPDLDIIPIVTPERRIDIDPLTYLAKQL